MTTNEHERAANTDILAHTRANGEQRAVGSQTNGSASSQAWYVVRSKPRAESLASASLQARGLQTYLPSWRQRRKGGTAYVEPLFPGYLFVQCDGRVDWQLRARSAPNVVRLLGGDKGAPEPVPPPLIEEIRRRCEQQIATPFVPGERVRVMRGPFRELDAVFDGDCSGRDRARILVHLLNRLVPVVVDIQTLRRAH